MQKVCLVGEIDTEWRKGNETVFTGAWDSDERNEMLDADGIAAGVLFRDGIAAGVLFRDGIAEHDAPPFPGPPRATMGPPRATMGPPRATMGPPRATTGPPRATTGPPRVSTGVSFSVSGS